MNELQTRHDGPQRENKKLNKKTRDDIYGMNEDTSLFKGTKKATMGSGDSHKADTNTLILDILGALCGTSLQFTFIVIHNLGHS